MEFTACKVRKCVSVNVADNLPDSSRTFLNLSLSRTASLDPRIKLHPEAKCELYVIKNALSFHEHFTDFITVGYSSATYTASESDKVVVLTLLIIDPSSGRAPRAFTLITSTEDGTASMHDFLVIK